MNALESVVVAGHAQISGDALTACAEANISVTALTGAGKVRFQSGRGIGGNVHLRVAQFRCAADPVRSLGVARSVVAGKLANSDRLVQRWRSEATGARRRFFALCSARIRERVAQLAEAADADHLRGIEGDGARVYFRALRRHVGGAAIGKTFGSRSRRPPRDPVNAALSFVYGLWLGPITGALEAVGLDPQIGFLHGIRSGRPGLALDVLEEFRPALADRFVVGLVMRGMLTDSDFNGALGGAVYLSDGGRRKLLAAFDEYKQGEVFHPVLARTVARGALPVIQATLMARHLRGDAPVYAPFVGEG